MIWRSFARRFLRSVGLLDPLRKIAGRQSEHGHTLLMRLMAADTIAPAAGYLIEVGTTREKIEGQESTLTLARFAESLGLPFVTVDMDPANTRQAEIDLAGVQGAKAVTAKGEEYLAAFPGGVAAAYLDAFDIAHGGHSQYRVDRYRELLDTEITNDGAASMHRACAEALATKVVDGGLVVIDDTWRVGQRYAGKGATAVPFLLENGFRIAGVTRTAIGLQRTSSPPG